MKYLLPRVECIVLGSIGFDLTLNIPHNYVQLCCREAFGMKTKDVDKVINNTYDLSYFIRFFLDISLNSSLSVSYSPRVLAAAAVRYAIGKFPSDRLPRYDSSWLAKLGVDESEVREIIERRHEISCIVEAMQRLQKPQRAAKRPLSSVESSAKRVHTPLGDSNSDSSEETEKREDAQSDDSSSRAVRSESVTSLPAQPEPLIPSPARSMQPAPLMTADDQPAPLMSVAAQPEPLISSPDRSAEPEPLLPINTQPEPLIVSSDSSSQPAPLLSRADSVGSSHQVPLIASQSMEEEPAPFIPAISSMDARREDHFWVPDHGRMFGKRSQGNTKTELIVTAI